MSASSQTIPHKLGDYEIVQLLATGGMAEVYVARRRGARGFTKLVALKRILPRSVSEPHFISMFIDEARVCSGLTHPNLVEVFDFGEEGGELFMAMELVDGTNCAKLVRAAAARDEAVPLEDVLFLILNVLRGLEFAHDAEDEEGKPLHLVHRDVSPGNILISRSGAIKLADFGIVRAAHLQQHAESGQLQGKLGYMSPEQVMGHELDRRSDLFTLGIVFAELLTGRPLFSHGTESEILYRIRDANIETFHRYGSELPQELQEIVKRALARDLEQRFQHAGAFAEAIEQFVRQHRLVLGPLRLAAYVEALGLVKPASRSGEFRLRGVVDSTPRVKPLRRAVVSATSSIHPVTYQVRLEDGSLHGPLPLARVLEGLITGRFPVSSQVSRNGGPFLTLREHPELRRIASRSMVRWDVTVTSQGNTPVHFDARSLPSRLYQIATSSATVVLLAIHKTERRKIHLKNGRVTLVSSTEPHELLGERLRQAGRILPVELDMALALAPRHGGRVGDALVGLGILQPLELFQALYEQTLERASALLHWEKGDLWLLPPEAHEGDGLPWGLSFGEIITHGILQFAQEPTLRHFLQPLWNTPLLPGSRAAPCPMALGLPSGPSKIILEADGERSLADLYRALSQQGISPLEILAGAYIGLSCGSLKANGWTLQNYNCNLFDLEIAIVENTIVNLT